MGIKCPVVLIIYKRPDKTKQVFDKIAEAKPEKLLIIADGPRVPEEEQKCLQCREITDLIDWHCDVEKNFSSVNLGCKQRISSGLDWVFNLYDEAIILEDDCLPHPSFFVFCEELLKKYRDDKRIMHISGDNFSPFGAREPYSYYYSKYPHVWGWATWKRAWQSYDVNISLWKDENVRNAILENFSHSSERKFWNEIFSLVSKDQLDTWDYQWAFNCFVNNGLSINPSRNLVSNIGFTPDATHTISSSDLANLPLSEIKFPLVHPLHVLPDNLEDKIVREKFFLEPNLFKKYMHKFKSRLKHIERLFS